MRVKVEIGEIVLHGFEKITTAQIEKAVEAELVNLIANDGLQGDISYQNRELGTIDGGSINLAQGLGDATSLGRGIARSIYGSLGGSR